jgi:hypothetical protein
VDKRRAVRCTIGTSRTARVKASVRVAHRSRTVTGNGRVAFTVKAGRRLTGRSRVRVTASIGDAAARVTVSPGRSARTTLER